ncbi:MAG: hypothetical protein VYA26_07790 [Actinomycetota bacterium]|nr:hypothetical protein [Actinomycetota bacterium]MED5394338.1 hypothetical protein [Actinomycetota bacterium]
MGAVVGTAVRRDRDMVYVAGPDARSYLQGQLSQDVDALAAGESAYTFVLQPNGKVDAWLRVTRMADDAFLLDVEAGWGEVVVVRLTRFLLRTNCTVELLDWQLVTVMDTDPATVDIPVGEVIIPVDWPGLQGVDVLGPSVDVPDGMNEVDGSVWEYRRIAAGIPAMGADMNDSTIPGATGVVNRSVSFTKGCYTGQELVARVDSRSAGTPTRLVRAVGNGPTPATGSEITLDGDLAGRLTSVAVDADGAGFGFVALADVRRAVMVPATVNVGDVEVSLLAD